MLAVTGLFILPHRRGRLKRDLARKVEVLRKEVEETLESRFRGQVSEYAQTLREAFQPELETTLAQEKSMALANERLAQLQERGAGLKQRIPKG